MNSRLTLASALLDPPPLPDLELHVMQLAEAAGGVYFAECSCGWICDPQLTRQAATSLHCGIEDAELQGEKNRFIRNTKRFADAEFDRALPQTTRQV